MLADETLVVPTKISAELDSKTQKHLYNVWKAVSRDAVTNDDLMCCLMQCHILGARCEYETLENAKYV